MAHVPIFFQVFFVLELSQSRPQLQQQLTTSFTEQSFYYLFSQVSVYCVICNVSPTYPAFRLQYVSTHDTKYERVHGVQLCWSHGSRDQRHLHVRHVCRGPEDS